MVFLSRYYDYNVISNHPIQWLSLTPPTITKIRVLLNYRKPEWSITISKDQQLSSPRQKENKQDSNIKKHSQKMYKSVKKKRTTKELFSLLRQKVLAYCKNHPKIPPPQLNHTDIIFPGQIIFRKDQDQIDYGQSSISKSQMASYSNYLQYDFPLQKYHLKFDNNVLNPLKLQTLLSFGQTEENAYKPLCIDSEGQKVVCGWSNGTVMLFQLSNIKNIIWLNISPNIQIVQIQILQQGHVIIADNNQKVYVLELVNGKFKIQFQFQYLFGDIIMKKSLLINNSIVTLVSDSQGNLSKLTFKKIFLVQTTDCQVVYKNSPMIFSVIPPYFLKYPPSDLFSYPNTMILAANNSKSCIVMYFDFNRDVFQVLFVLNNFTNYQSDNFNQKYLSVQFLELQVQNKYKIIIACSFGNRLFFIMMDWDKQQQKWNFRQSRRVKSRQNILRLIYLKEQKYLIVTQKTIYYCLTSNTIFFDLFKSLSQLKIISLKLDTPFEQCCRLHQKMALVNFNRLVWIGGNSNKVQCCKVMDWNELYTSISRSEALYLLYFLIMSKYMKSSYFEKPVCFKQKQLLFPKSTIQEKQLLLEYYYIMKQVPPNSLGSSDQMCQLLLPFIFNHQIDNLSDQQLQDLIRYWEQNQVLIVQQIIMSGVDKGWQIAIKNAWIRALMKIARLGDDYQFPLLKMCGYFILNENDELLGSKYTSQIIKYMSLGINKDLHQIQQQQYYEDMIKVFLKILLDKNLFIRLAKYQPGKVTSLFTDLFLADSFECIQRMPMQSFLLECSVKYSLLVVTQNSVAQIIYSHCIGSLVQNYEQAIQKKLIPQQAVLIWKNYFVFIKERMLEIIMKLISSESMAKKATKILNKPQILDPPELEIQSQYLILKLLGLLKIKYQTSSEQLNLLLQQCQKSRNRQLISIQLMKPQKRYESILSKYINSSNSRIKEQVFSWLEEVTRQILKEQETAPETMRQLNRIVLNRMKQLIHINKEKTRQYIQTFFKNSEKKLINRIQNDPQLQLEYVQLVLQSQIAPDQELLNLHISLLCKLQPNKIISVVERNETKYNLDNVLEICLQAPDMDSVIIYLYQKVGEVYKAVAKHLELFYEEWQSVKRQRTSSFNKRNQFFQAKGGMDIQALRKINLNIESKITNSLLDMKHHLQHILELIHKQFNQLQLYSLVVNLISKIYFIEEQDMQATRSQDALFLNKLTQFLGMVIMDLAREGHIDFLIEDVLGKYKSMSLRQMKQHIKDVYSCMTSSRTVIQNILHINRQNLIDLNYYTRTYISKSISASGNCSLCEISIVDKETALLFSCGHLYHLQCAQCQDEVDYCSQCIMQDVINGMIEHPQLSLQRLIAHRDSRLKFRNVSMTRQQVQSKKKHDLAINRKLDKMKIFDKKVAQLSMQAQIIQLRLDTMLGI